MTAEDMDESLISSSAETLTQLAAALDLEPSGARSNQHACLIAVAVLFGAGLIAWKIDQMRDKVVDAIGFIER